MAAPASATLRPEQEVTMLIAAISGAVLHPFTAELDDEVLREQLLRLARRFLSEPAAGTRPGGG